MMTCRRSFRLACWPAAAAFFLLLECTQALSTEQHRVTVPGEAPSLSVDIEASRAPGETSLKYQTGDVADAEIVYNDAFTRMVRWFRGRTHASKGSSRHRRKLSEELAAFTSSAMLADWLMFVVGWLMLLQIAIVMEGIEFTHWYQHATVLTFWIATAVVITGSMALLRGGKVAEAWGNGYLMELTLSMENIFLYEIILVGFHVPAKQARKALFVVAVCQMFFQLFLFMGIASWLLSLESLPYLLGAWLIFLAIQTLKDDEHAKFEPANSEVFKIVYFGLRDRLLPYYHPEGLVFVEREGHWNMTMLGPVIGFLLTVMFAMEVDVTLAKIEEIPNHYLAWTSSVIAAFALPELFVVVQELMRRFYLLKTGISFLLFFFGLLLLFRSEIQISDMAEVLVMLSIVIGSIVMSLVLGYTDRKEPMYSEDWESTKCDMEEGQTSMEEGSPREVAARTRKMSPVTLFRQLRNSSRSASAPPGKFDRTALR
eukprot:TRINITY_DN494_c0_g2_i1.p1 TRINITY_DN494_c0_g2~~TRINITY_DN494_c0_g2_i1.p1  ORF type:complete len:485 (+),score=93.10 TRINITY_DN494_c0_g2_i1:251-1705(+)